MTKVKILGQECEDRKQPIEFMGCLMEGCGETNYEDFPRGFLTPSTYSEITLISKNYGSKDVFLCKKENGDEVIMFGHFNDGIV